MRSASSTLHAGGDKRFVLVLAGGVVALVVVVALISRFAGGTGSSPSTTAAAAPQAPEAAEPGVVAGSGGQAAASGEPTAGQALTLDAAMAEMAAAREKAPGGPRPGEAEREPDGTRARVNPDAPPILGHGYIGAGPTREPSNPDTLGPIRTPTNEELGLPPGYEGAGRVANPEDQVPLGAEQAVPLSAEEGNQRNEP